MRYFLTMLVGLFLTSHAFALSDDEAKKLKKGMKFDEVKTVTGTPGNILNDAGGVCEQKGLGVTIVWTILPKKAGERAYAISFCNGKVEEINLK